MLFDEKYFYSLLSAINSNIDSIDFRYNMDKKPFMQSSGINIFIGAYVSPINSNVDFIVNSIDLQYNMDNKTFIQSSGIYIFIGS